MLGRFIFLVLLTSISAHAAVSGTIVLLPRDWDHATPLRVAIWLHGYGANPSRLIEEPHYQATADALGIAIVGVPATQAVGKEAFVWTEVPDLDLKQITASLAEAERRSKAHFTDKSLFGFSQGAVVAAEIAARFPKDFKGAIILSPGAEIFPLPIAATEGNNLQHYFISTGARENPGNLDYARKYQKILSAIGAKVVYREVEGMSSHTRPPDWPERFREWTSLTLGIAGK